MQEQPNLWFFGIVGFWMLIQLCFVFAFYKVWRKTTQIDDTLYSFGNRICNLLEEISQKKQDIHIGVLEKVGIDDVVATVGDVEEVQVLDLTSEGLTKAV